MLQYVLRENVTALRWIRSPGRDPQFDNADEIMEFIGRDRILGRYEARFGDEILMFLTTAAPEGMCRLKAYDWVVIGPDDEPMAIPARIFECFVIDSIGD